MMTMKIWRRFRNESGQALVEAALTLPMLTLMLLGTAELGRVAFAAIELSNAARAGVQYGAQTPVTAADTNGIQTAAEQDANEVYNAGNATNFQATVNRSCVCSTGSATVSCSLSSCPTSQLEEVLTVQTSVSFDPMIHVPVILNHQYTLHGQAIEKVLNN